MNLSMHKKSEVDLRVAQELKNNQDFIYQTNQALQGLSQSIIALSLQNEKLHAQFESDKKSMHIILENFMSDMDERHAMFSKHMSDKEQRMVLILSKVQGQLDAFRTQMVCAKDVDEKFETVAGLIKSFEASLQKLTGFTTNSISMLHGNISSEISQVRKDLTPDPDAIHPLKAQVEDLLNSMRVDFQGLIRELALIKKDVAYGEKKFENIYTLIERLKSGDICHKKE